MTTPIYNPNVPQFPKDSFATTQPQLLDNFLSIYNNFMINHISLNAASGAGNHTIVQLVEQNNAFQTLPSDISIYTKNVESQTDQVFFRYPGNGQEVQFTNYQIYNINVSGGVTMFFTFLPGNILIYFGSFTSLANNLLNLMPPIAKNIITMSFCPIGNANVKPQVTLQTAVGGFYKSIKVVAGTLINQPAPSCFFLVMANI
jgi:hypothetical protein